MVKLQPKKRASKNLSFWTQLESKKLDKETTETFLLTKLGTPSNQTQTNLYQEIIKKINSYYFSQEIENYTTYSLFGFVNEIVEKKYKEGKRKGQTYYLLKMGEPKGEKIKANQEDLAKEKWKQIEKLTILGKNLVFKYRKWITNKELLDFYPRKKQ